MKRFTLADCPNEPAARPQDAAYFRQGNPRAMEVFKYRVGKDKVKARRRKGQGVRIGKKIGSIARKVYANIPKPQRLQWGALVGRTAAKVKRCAPIGQTLHHFGHQCARVPRRRRASVSDGRSRSN